MTDSVKDFKYRLFYVRPLNDAAKKEVAELDEKVLVGKQKFPLSCSQGHLKYNGSEYACRVKSRRGGCSDPANAVEVGG